MAEFVIFSFKETKLDDMHEPMFWNSQDGWGSLSTATRFTQEEVNEYIMPNDGMAVQLSEIYEGRIS